MLKSITVEKRNILALVLSIAIALASWFSAEYLLPYTDVKADAERELPPCNLTQSPWIDKELYYGYCQGFPYRPPPYTEYRNALPVGGAYVLYLVSLFVENADTLQRATEAIFAIFAGASAYLCVRKLRLKREPEAISGSRSAKFKGVKFTKHSEAKTKVLGLLHRLSLVYVPGLVTLAVFGAYSSESIALLLVLLDNPVLWGLAIAFSPFILPLYLLRLLLDRGNTWKYVLGLIPTLLMISATGMHSITTPLSPVFRYWCFYCEFCIYQPLTFKEPMTSLVMLFSIICYAIVVILYGLGLRSPVLGMSVLGASVPPQSLVLLPVYAKESNYCVWLRNWVWVPLLILAECLNVGIIMLFFKVRNPLALTSPAYICGLARDLLIVLVAFLATRQEFRFLLEKAKLSEIDAIRQAKEA